MKKISQKMFCFKVEETEEGKIIVSNISYEDFLASNYEKNREINEISWESYKEQLKKGSINVETYQGAKYIDVKKNDGKYFFGCGLNKKLISEMVGVGGIENEEEKMSFFVLYNDNTYKRIKESDFMNMLDEGDRELAKDKIKQNVENISFGVIHNENKKILFLCAGTKIDEEVMKKKISSSEYKENVEKQTEIEKNLKKPPKLMSKVLHTVTMSTAKEAIKIMEDRLSRENQTLDIKEKEDCRQELEKLRELIKEKKFKTEEEMLRQLSYIENSLKKIENKYHII